MKNFIKRISGFVLALALILGFSGVFTVQGLADEGSTGTITIKPSKETRDGETNTYRVYKVFDATVDSADKSRIVYSLLPGKSASETGWTSSKMDSFFTVSGGNVTAKSAATGEDGSLSADAVEAIRNYVESDSTTWPTTGTGDYVNEVTSTGKSDAVLQNISSGYYYITTATGSVVAINTANPDVTIDDKHAVPSVDKVITSVDDGSKDGNGKNAIAQLGTDVEFRATVMLKKGVHVTFNDTMDGLTLDKSSIAISPSTGFTSSINTENLSNDVTFSIDFTDVSEDQTVEITYTAKVNRAALADDPVTNKAHLEYGDNHSVTPTPPDETDIYNAQFTVTKHDNSDKPLAGAGFVLKNGAGKFYKYDESSATVSWVDSEDEATEYTSGSDGHVPSFIGLADGTYTLVEKTVPDGYAKAEDASFTVNANDYSASNLSQSATVVNVPDSEIPSTGGRGTMLFYLIGGVLVAGAAVLLILRRRKV